MSKSEKPKILFYVGNLARGGAQRVIVNLANYFNSLSYPVTIVTAKAEEGEYTYDTGIKRVISDLTVQEISTNGLKNFIRRLKKLRKIWKAEKPNIIIAFMGKSNFMAIVSSLFLNIPVLVSVRSDPNREYGTTLMKVLSKTLFVLASGVVLQTEEAKRYFPIWIRKKAIIMPNSLNPNFIKPRFKDVRKNEIVTVGSIDENKNHALLIDAFALLHHDYPEMKVVIYGDGAKRKELEEKVHNLKLQEKVLFPGRETAVYDKIYDARIFVLTSNVEGMPNALIEAMALGLAVISTDCPCGGPKTLIEEGENGLLIPVGDVRALEKAIRKILDHADLEEILGKNAHKISAQVQPDLVNRKWLNYITSQMES